MCVFRAVNEENNNLVGIRWHELKVSRICDFGYFRVFGFFFFNVSSKFDRYGLHIDLQSSACITSLLSVSPLHQNGPVTVNDPILTGKHLPSGHHSSLSALFILCLGNCAVTCICHDSIIRQLNATGYSFIHLAIHI